MCIIRHTVGWSILKKYYLSTCINMRFVMLENSYTHISKKQFCISGHLVKRLTSFLLFVPLIDAARPEKSQAVFYGIGYCQAV